MNFLKVLNMRQKSRRFEQLFYLTICLSENSWKWKRVDRELEPERRDGARNIISQRYSRPFHRGSESSLEVALWKWSCYEQLRTPTAQWRTLRNILGFEFGNCSRGDSKARSFSILSVSITLMSNVKKN